MSMGNLSAKNFRIGNIVKAKTTSDEFNIVKEIGFSDEQRGYYLRLETVNHGVWLEHNGENLILGIPITEKWLVNLGFEKDNNGSYWIDLQTHYLELIPSNGYWYPTYVQVPEMSHEPDQRVSTNRIEFVHELQNLFFAITGSELEFKTDV